MIDTYARFAYTGSPDGGSLHFALFADTAYTRVDATPSVEYNLRPSECAFWDGLSP
jgi:hypothetical protein